MRLKFSELWNVPVGMYVLNKCGSIDEVMRESRAQTVIMVIYLDDVRGNNC